ncbi:hypothetical protein BGX31_001527 [Mortierella sp. GBA43]|nr:hypothetical protein BGX31_001527 [Mortierella sp. GBA43]
MPEEIQTVNKVLSTNQATWARTNGLLRQFVQNKHENRDVFKKQESRLLAALQDDMRLHHQNITKTSVSVNDQGAVPLLENMVANCFQKAVGEPIVEWLKRVRGKNPDQTISLECSVSSQRKEVIDPPMNGCRSTIEVTSMTLFSWVILSPQSTLIDALTIQSALNVSHTECEPLPPSDDRDNADDCVEGIDFASPEREVFEGAIVRWSIMQPDGSFNPVHYKRNWREYSGYVNKAMLDILRYSAAAAYLGITIPSLDHLSAMPEYGTTKLDPESLAAFGSIIKKFAEGWSSAAIPLKPSIHQNFGLKVCLGFEQYDDTSKAAAISGIHPSNLMKAVEHVIQAAQLPDDKDIKSIMMGVKYSDNEFTWTSESITYMGPDGKNRFLYLTKHANPKTNKIDLIYGMVNSEFSLAPDILVVHEKWSMLWGTFGGGRTYYRKVPHVVTLEDAKILEMYFEMIVLHKMAMVTGLPVPQHPDLTVFCDK